jgi:hypothetical protein
MNGVRQQLVGGIRILSVLLIGLVAMTNLPVTQTAARAPRELVIHAIQCPPGYTGNMAEDHCADPAPEQKFTLRTGDDPSAPEDEAVSDSTGTATFSIPDDATTIHLSGPPFYISTTSDHPRPVLQVRCFDEEDQPIEGMGGDPGREYTLDTMPGGNISCDWYIGNNTSDVSAWQGGYGNLKPGVYPGEFVAIYGANSDYPSASVTFELETIPDAGMALEISGVDDELEGQVEISASLNGAEIYAGPSDFPSWYEGMSSPGEMQFELPANLLTVGHNTFTISNLQPDANFGEPPWVLVGECRLRETVPA